MPQVHLVTLLWSACLSAWDLRSQSYPLWLWLAYTGGLVCFFPPTPASLLLCGLGLLAQVYDRYLGAGDLLYLATLALVLDLYSLVLVVQLASLLGIVAFLGLRKRGATLPFIPYLSLAYLLVVASLYLW